VVLVGCAAASGAGAHVVTPVRELIDGLARLAVGVGVDVQQGQDVVVMAHDVEHAPIVRAVAEAAYSRGARFVSAVYWDQHIKRSRLLHAPEQTLTFVPDWFDGIITEAAARRSAIVSVVGDPSPNLLDDIPGERAALDTMPTTAKAIEILSRGDVAWTVVPGVSPGVARTVLGEPDVDRLWRILVPLLRLDADDPERAWSEHIAGLVTRAALLDAHRFSAVRFRGGGTDLTVGLLDRARWTSCAMNTRWGHRTVINLPTEEVFTTPDYRRTEGVVHATRPMELTAGGRVEHLVLEFEQGRVTEVRATRGAELVRAQMASDPGAAFLGEIALVDGSSPVPRTGVVFHNVLIDENATSHIAWGDAYTSTVPDLPADAEAQRALGFNRSGIHQDAMIGGPEVDVHGLTTTGAEIPIIARDQWVLEAPA
jgi:aminopeptidase